MTMPTQPPATGRVDAPQPAVSVNGTAPGAAADDCEDCVTGGQRAVAVVGLLVAVGIAFMAADVLTDFKLSALFGLSRKEEPASVDNPGS